MLAIITPRLHLIKPWGQTPHQRPVGVAAARPTDPSGVRPDAGGAAPPPERRRAGDSQAAAVPEKKNSFSSGIGGTDP